MQFVIWSDQFSVGVQSLDDQHAILFDTINDLHKAMSKGLSRKIVGGLLQTLLKYTRAHFADEERLLEWTGFPGLEQHKQIHRELIVQLEGHQASYAKGEPNLNDWIVGYFSNWMQTHILEADQAYGQWIEQQFPLFSCSPAAASPETAVIQ